MKKFVRGNITRSVKLLSIRRKTNGKRNKKPVRASMTG